MNKFILTLIAILSLTFGTIAQTNQTVGQIIDETKTEAVKTVQTNLNQVLIEILSGVKNAGGEIYGASKEAIHKSVDFVTEQAPDVIKQFILWRLCEALTWCVIWAAVAGIIYFFAYKLLKYQDKASEHSGSGDPTEHAVTVFFKWVFCIIGSLVLLLGIGGNTLDVVKIKVAPKVYILEYVVDTIKHSNNGR